MLSFSESNPNYRSIAALISADSTCLNQYDISQCSFLFGLRKPGGSMGNRWELPGGKVEQGESEIDALKRELNEEFGIGCLTWTYVAEANFKNRDKSYLVRGYLVQVTQLPIFHPEHQKLDFFTLTEALSLDLVDSDRTLINNLMGALKSR